ncbi:MAG: TraB/GumN family protein [Aestuariivirga sp.]
MIRIFLALLFLLVPAAAGLAQTDPPMCGGKNLLDELRKKDAAKAESVLQEADATPNHDSLIWKVEPASGEAASWLVGTAHVTDGRLSGLASRLNERITSASVAVFELEEVADKNRMMVKSFLQARFMAMPPGQSLWDIVPDDKEAAIRNHPSLAGGQADAIFAYQPWVVVTMLSMPMCETQRQLAGFPSFDERLARIAVDAGVPVKGLETLEEQLSIMSGIALEDQAKQLVAVAELGGYSEDLLQTLIDLYLDSKVAAFMPLAKVLWPEFEAGEFARIGREIEQGLILKRNHIMAERARAHIDAGNAFIAVGALHLPGKEGVVELLRQAGYKVTKAE